MHTVKGFIEVNEAEVDVILEFPCFLFDPADFGNLVSGSSAFSKPTLYIWHWELSEFSVCVLLKPSLKDFEQNLAHMWNECNCSVDGTLFLAVTLFGIKMKTDLYQSCGH